MFELMCVMPCGCGSSKCDREGMHVREGKHVSYCSPESRDSEHVHVCTCVRECERTGVTASALTCDDKMCAYRYWSW
jgi:hypothetical protein